MFKGSIKLLTVAGIGIYLHWTFLILLGFIAMARWEKGAQAVVETLLLYISLFICVTLHELGHALTAKRYGITTRDITLLPIGGVARLERMPENPWQELWIALAGPAVNVVIAGVLLLILGRMPDFDAPLIAGAQFMTALAAINIMLVVFNMLPAFPMDGGRVLRAILAMFINRVKATQIAAIVGQCMAFIFAAWGFGLLSGFGLPGNVFLLFIALFVYIGAAAEAQAVEAAQFFRGALVRDAMMTRFVSLRPDDVLAVATQELLAGSQHEFPVISDGRPVGMLTHKDLFRALAQPSEGLTVGRAMQDQCAAIDAAAPLDTAMSQLQESTCPAMVVTEHGRVVGLLTPENISEFVTIRAAVNSRPGRA